MHLFNFAGLDFCPFGSQSEVFLRKSHKWSSTVDCQSVYKPTFRFYFKSFWCKFWWKWFPEIQQIPIYSLMRIDIALIVIYNLIFMASTLYLYNFLKAMTIYKTTIIDTNSNHLPSSPKLSLNTAYYILQCIFLQQVNSHSSNNRRLWKITKTWGNKE